MDAAGSVLRGAPAGAPQVPLRPGAGLGALAAERALAVRQGAGGDDRHGRWRNAGSRRPAAGHRPRGIRRSEAGPRTERPCARTAPPSRPRVGPSRAAQGGSRGTADPHHRAHRRSAPAIPMCGCASTTRTPTTLRRGACRACCRSSAARSASAASDIPPRMPRTGVAPTTPASRWPRSTTPSHPSIRIPWRLSRHTQRSSGCSPSADELGIDRRRIAVAGTSAGANLAAAVTLVNRDRAGRPLRLQVLEVPVVDLTGGHLDLRATRALGIPRFIALRELRSVARTYLADPRQAASSPMPHLCSPHPSRACRPR